MPNINRPMSEKEWRARDDAHALATAEEIKEDPARLQNAKSAAQQMVEEEQERIAGLRKAAKGGTKGTQAKAPSSPAQGPKAQGAGRATPDRTSNDGQGGGSPGNKFNVFQRLKK